MAIAALLAALTQADQSYERVHDYTALFVKQEINKEGSLGAPENIYLKFSKPFKMVMEWTNTDKKGLQVLYERGRHDNKLAIHKPGLFFGLKQVIFLPQSSPWVREGSQNFDIEDAGLGTFLKDFGAAVRRAQKENKLSVETDGRVFDVKFPGTVMDEDYFAARVKLRFDANGLPVHQELYDWSGRLAGIYDYRDQKLNVGPDDPALKKRLNRFLYRVYSQ